MKAILFGATGMVGSGVLQACLDDSRVEAVLVVGRSACGVSHPKVQELLHADFFDYTAIQARWVAYDVCFFCLGVSSVGMDAAAYRRMTYDLTLAAARSMLAVNPHLTFCYVSGSGTDSSEQGRVRWARVKGETENALLALPFKAAYMFRPGYIQPLNGVRSKTRLYQAIYDVVAPLYPLLRLMPRWVTSSSAIGHAMIRVAAEGYPSPILESLDINRVARAERGQETL